MGVQKMDAHKGVRFAAEKPSLDTHLWLERNPRQFKQGGETITLRQCWLCRRDFAQGLNGADWSAVYVGIFKVEPLPKAINDRWLSEKCPTRHLPDDDVARGMIRR